MDKQGSFIPFPCHHKSKRFKPSQMNRWKAIARSSSIAQGLVLCFVTFCIILPLLCHRLLYSYYFMKYFYLDSMSDDVLKQSYERGQSALRYWEGSSTMSSPDFTDIAKGPELLVTVVTARRPEGRDFHYLLQVMQQLATLLRGCSKEGERRCAEVLVCDVESGPYDHEDASLLESQFLVVRRSREEKWRNKGHVNTFEREKRDYVFCLRKGWDLVRPRNVVVMEDDAFPRNDFFPVIKNLLSRKFSLDTLYIKLYHPERLQRYWNPEPYRIMEWVGLGLVGATALLLTFPYCRPLSFHLSFSAAHILFFTLYFMAVAELAGRHYLLEARRLSPHFYAVSPATECCTPAMLFPGNSSLRTAEYLDGSFCVKGNAKDLVLYQMARTIPGERAHSVEPNLITHIGAFSSVRPNPSSPRLL